ncbi:ester hydrolase C11orf54 homolog [Diadema setosum]|uniref:ester hydrolase C11orf54 homolog n=1 Tax=Diadema setosum TaxID=31175 RepID=UPI003B3ACF28
MAGNGDLTINRTAMFVPSMEELAEVLQRGLRICYENADVNVVDCPDLTKEPFHQAAAGICGSPRLADVGGVPNLVPVVKKEKKYNLDEVARQVDLPGGFIIGAGAGPCDAIGVNSEMITNIKTKSENSEGNNQTHIALLTPEDGSVCLRRSPSRDFNLLGNFLVSEGKQGKVLEVKASIRRGVDDFVTAMRIALHKHYGKEKFIGLGGVFLMVEGVAKIHIMPDFSKTPLNSEEDVNRWLQFFDFKGPLECASVFVSHDPGLDLRVNHTHCFSQHGQGGHYHYDMNGKTASYHGYFIPAEWMYRIDPPQHTHMVGRD